MSSEPERFDPDALAGLPPELVMARLPPGRHGLPRAFVVHNQRLRLLAAMLRVLPAHGYPAITIAHITGEAGVSRAVFYQQFASKEECFLATYEVASRWFCESVEGAVAGEDEWPARIRTGAAEALRADHPGRPGLPDDLADLLLGGVVALIARYVDSDRASACRTRPAALVEYLLIL